MRTLNVTKAPLYDVDRIMFFVDHEVARALGSLPGWFWWECYPGCLPEGDAFGPFPTSYRALKDATEPG
jgi:hypothetical protein